MDDDTADVDHHDPEDDAADRAVGLRDADVMLAERVRLAADHRDDVKTGSGDDDDVTSAEDGAETGRDVPE